MALALTSLSLRSSEHCRSLAAHTCKLKFPPSHISHIRSVVVVCLRDMRSKYIFFWFFGFFLYHALVVWLHIWPLRLSTHRHYLFYELGFFSIVLLCQFSAKCIRQGRDRVCGSDLLKQIDWPSICCEIRRNRRSIVVYLHFELLNCFESESEKIKGLCSIFYRYLINFFPFEVFMWRRSLEFFH